MSDVARTSQKDSKTQNVSGAQSNRESHHAPADEKGRMDEVLSNQDTSERSFKEEE